MPPYLRRQFTPPHGRCVPHLKAIRKFCWDDMAMDEVQSPLWKEQLFSPVVVPMVQPNGVVWQGQSQDFRRALDNGKPIHFPVLDCMLRGITQVHTFICLVLGIARTDIGQVVVNALPPKGRVRNRPPLHHMLGHKNEGPRL